METIVKKVIEEFLQRKKECKLEKIYKDAVKEIENRIKKSSESDEIKEQAVNIVGVIKTKEQSKLDYQKEKYNNLLNLEYQNLDLLDDIKKKNKKDIINLVNEWLDNVAKKANKIDLEIVTHVAKLTHSRARASNININVADESVNKNSFLVTANCSKSLLKDFTYSNAPYFSIAEFLQLPCGREILGKVICSHPNLFRCYARGDEQLEYWREQISLVFSEKCKSSHELLKQVYFPVETSYHLLTPLVSSSMAQIIYERTRGKEIQQKMRLVGKAKKEGLYSRDIYISIPKTAILQTTQNQHQNVSGFNNKRKGKLNLFSNCPPQWKTQIRPPINIKTIFNKELNFQAKESIKKLRNLLLVMTTKELSENLRRKQLIAALITEIADIIFAYISQIYSIKAGWSHGCELPIHQQYWLDPFRADEEFQSARDAINWQEDIIVDFAKWINTQIRHKKLTLGVPQEKCWGKLFSRLLREFNAITNAELAK